jgi:uncharacterized membrane protein HdeD (DUF308 family)
MNGDNITEFEIVKNVDPRKSALIGAAVMIIIGALILFLKSEALKWILIGAGVLFVALGAYSIYNGHKSGNNFGMVLSAIILVIGLALIIAPNFFESLLMVILAIMLIVIGMFNLLNMKGVSMAKGPRMVGVLIGVLMIAMGVYALFNLDNAADLVMSIIGAVMIVGGVLGAYNSVAYN